MKGSSINNIKVEAGKKLVHCSACGCEGNVGKFAKKDWKCNDCTNIPKGKSGMEEKAVRLEVSNKPAVKAESEHVESFGAKLTKVASQLNFDINDKRIYRKKYAVEGGAVATVHIMVEPGSTVQKPRLEYFSLTIQRAVGVDEDFRKLMPAEAAADCEVVIAELGVPTTRKIQIGAEKCDGCGMMVDEFGVDNKHNRILCIRPNRTGCFHKLMSSQGAESAL